MVYRQPALQLAQMIEHRRALLGAVLGGNGQVQFYVRGAVPSTSLIGDQPANFKEYLFALSPPIDFLGVIVITRDIDSVD